MASLVYLHYDPAKRCQDKEVYPGILFRTPMDSIGSIGSMEGYREFALVPHRHRVEYARDRLLLFFLTRTTCVHAPVMDREL